MEEGNRLQTTGCEEGFRLEPDAASKNLKLDAEKGFFASLEDLAGGKRDLGLGVS